MRAYYLGIFFITILILHSTAQPVFDCPMTVAVDDSAKLTCSNLINIVIIKNPAGITVGNCFERTTCVIPDGIEGINITFIEDNTILLTVQDIDKEDEGVWTCESKSTAECSLMVYKLPSCEISSTSSTNDLSLGQDLPLNINLTDYYCTNSIVWNLTIGGQSQNVAGFRDREEIENITSRIVTYSPTVTSSFTGRVELTFNCNDETNDVSCSGVKELQLRDSPSCNLTSHDNTDDLTVGNNLTLAADIEEYPCTTGIKYALVSGSGMIAEFVKNGTTFYATFEVQHAYLDKQLQLKYTCNSVSATTRTEGVTILRTKDGVSDSQTHHGLVIGLVIGLLSVFGVSVFVIVYCIKRHTSTTKNDLPYSDVHDTVSGRKNSPKVTANDAYTEVCGDGTASPKKLRVVTDQEGKSIDKSRPRSECHMVQNVAYEGWTISDKIKAEQKGNHLICPEGTYAKVDKHRSQDNRAPDLLVSVH